MITIDETARLTMAAVTTAPRVNVRTEDLKALLDSFQEHQTENKALKARVLAWREDAAARLQTYIGLMRSKLLGKVSQVRVSLIMPTVAMLELDQKGESCVISHCDRCGCAINFGDTYYPFGVDDGESIDLCEEHGKDAGLVPYCNNWSDISSVIRKAKKVLGES